MLYIPEGMFYLHTASVESVLGTLVDIEGFSSEWEVGSACVEMCGVLEDLLSARMQKKY